MKLTGFGRKERKLLAMAACCFCRIVVYLIRTEARATNKKFLPSHISLERINYMVSIRVSMNVFILGDVPYELTKGTESSYELKSQVFLLIFSLE